jgi:hypothetical protein
MLDHEIADSFHLKSVRAVNIILGVIIIGLLGLGFTIMPTMIESIDFMLLVLIINICSAAEAHYFLVRRDNQADD